MNSIRRRLIGDANPFVAVTSASIAALFVTFVLIWPEFANKLSSVPAAIIDQYFTEYLLWTVTFVTLVALALFVSPWGKVRLGKDGESPEFSRFSWFAMLFGAGVGTGILFWGVAEPMFHLQGNPFATAAGIEPGSAEAGSLALRITLFHWGLHGWALYSLVGLCLAYFAFRKGLPLSIRSALHPIFGDRIYGPLGHIIDLLAIFSTLFGIAVTLGLGTSQMASGIQYLFGIEASNTVKITLILVVSTVATLSTVSGVNRGIKRLSQLNIWLTIGLLSFIIVAGPSLFIAGVFFEESGRYFLNFLPMGLFVDPATDSSWQSSWTLFYWGWWIAWGPFVGMFIARISRGRSLREYLFGTIFGATVGGFVFLTIFGATAMDIQLNGPGGLVEAVNADMTQALFRMFELLGQDWATWPIAFLATVLIVTWFVTSSDSGNLVICTIVCMGRQRPPVALRFFWGTTIALVAGSLLLGGGLSALQAASTSIAIPFALVITLMVIGLLKALWQTERGETATSGSKETS